MKGSKAVFPWIAALAFTAAVSGAAERNDAAQVEKIFGRALDLLAQVREGSVDQDDFMLITRLTDGRQTAQWSSTRTSTREPGLRVSSRVSSFGTRSLDWSDGKVMRSFFATAQSKSSPNGEFTETALPEGNYRAVGTRKFDNHSPVLGIVLTLDGAFSGDAQREYKYLGREELRGERCDVVEITTHMDEQLWSQARERYPQLPPTASVVQKMYLRVSDGRLLREETLEWTMVEVNGKIPDPQHINARCESTADFRYGPPLPQKDFEVARFNAVVLGAAGAKEGPMPTLVKIRDSLGVGDKLVGRPLPRLDLITLDGEAVRWEDFKGKVLILETWFIGCTQCKHAFPYYDSMRRQLAAQGVDFITINTGDSGYNTVAQIKEWMRKSKQPKFSFHWTRIAEPEKVVGEKLGFGGAPIFMIVGRDGTVVNTYIGFPYGPGGEDARLVEALREAGVKF